MIIDEKIDDFNLKQHVMERIRVVKVAGITISDIVNKYKIHKRLKWETDTIIILVVETRCKQKQHFCMKAMDLPVEMDDLQKVF